MDTAFTWNAVPLADPDIVASPCVNLCRLDQKTGCCEGCLRTLDEIAAWSAASSDQRRAILRAVEQRREEGKA